MHIKILGTRGKIEPSKPWLSKYSGVLIAGRKVRARCSAMPACPAW